MLWTLKHCTLPASLRELREALHSALRGQHSCSEAAFSVGAAAFCISIVIARCSESPTASSHIQVLLGREPCELDHTRSESRVIVVRRWVLSLKVDTAMMGNDHHATPQRFLRIHALPTRPLAPELEVGDKPFSL